MAQDTVATEETITVGPDAQPIVATPSVVGDAEPIDMSIGSVTNEAATLNEPTYNEPSQGELSDAEWAKAQKKAAKGSK